MKTLVPIVMLVLYPLALFSHPGKTDFRGGHKCWNGCAAWGLDYGEYHLHDKYFRPIRLNRKGKPAEASELTLEQAGPPQTVETKSAETATVYRYVTVVNEERVFPSDRELLLALLALLLLLLLAIISRRRKEKTTRS